MVSMAAKAADEGRGAGGTALAALVAVWAVRAMGRMMKNKRRLLRMMKTELLKCSKVYGKTPLYERSAPSGSGERSVRPWPVVGGRWSASEVQST
jgi:hypothetical protein